MGSCCGGLEEEHVRFAYQVQNCTKEIFMATKISFHGNKNQFPWQQKTISIANNIFHDKK
jgi:hypothetical protein